MGTALPGFAVLTPFGLGGLAAFGLALPAVDLGAAGFGAALETDLGLAGAGLRAGGFLAADPLLFFMVASGSKLMCRVDAIPGKPSLYTGIWDYFCQRYLNRRRVDKQFASVVLDFCGRPPVPRSLTSLI